MTIDLRPVNVIQLLVFGFVLVIAFFGIKAAIKMIRGTTQRAIEPEKAPVLGADGNGVEVTTTVKQTILPRPEQLGPTCRACKKSKAPATHHMPVTGYAHWFDAWRKKLSVMDDPRRPNELCAEHHRMESHLLLETLARGRVAAIQAEADTHRALALVEGGGGVALMQALSANVVGDDATQEAERYRKFDKPSGAPELPAPKVEAGPISKELS